MGGGGRKGEVYVVWASEGVVVSQFMFDKESNFFFGGGGFCKLTRNPNLKIFFEGGGGGGKGRGRGSVLA